MIQIQWYWWAADLIKQKSNKGGAIQLTTEIVSSGRIKATETNLDEALDEWSSRSEYSDMFYMTHSIAIDGIRWIHISIDFV